MTKFVNRAKMTTATTGTGTITLGSAVDGYQTFSAAGLVDTDVVRYTIEDGNNWEIGTGTYSSGTLTRTVVESSNSGSAINLSGEAVVFVTAAGKDVLTATQVVTLSDGAVDLTKGNYFELETDQNTTYTFDNPEGVDKFTIKQTLNSAVVANPYDIESLSYNSEVNQDVIPTGYDVNRPCYSSDGSKLYTVITQWDYSGTPTLQFFIKQYDLTGNYFPSSATLVNLTLLTTSVQTNTAAPAAIYGSESSSQGTTKGVAINSAGTKMLVSIPFSYVDESFVDRVTLAVFEVEMSTAHDVTTASIVDTFNVYTDTSSFSHPEGYWGVMLVDETGSNIYWLNQFGGSAYSLSTPFDLSTRGTVDQTGTFNDGNVTAAYRGSGNDLFVAMYNVSSDYVVLRLTASTGSWNDAVDSNDNPFVLDDAVGTSNVRFGSITFYNSGADFVAVGGWDNHIYKLSTEQATLPTVTYPNSVTWVDGAPSAIVDGEAKELDFVTTDGGTSYLGKSNNKVSAISSVNTVVITSTGTYTPPDNLLYADVIVTGAGGGAGGADGVDTGSGSAGGGGGSGGTIIVTLTKAQIGSSVPCTIGSGGSGGPSTGGNGTSGGLSSFSSSIGNWVGYGGGYGFGATTAGAYFGNGGSRGSYFTPNASIDSINIFGAYGGNGFIGDSTTYNALGGTGGSSYWGGGGKGGADSSGPTAGVTAQSYGAGGGGGVTSQSTIGAAGGNGADGVIVIKEYLA